jgi:hypothetical protein
MLTQDYLKSILHYDPISGVFTWKVNRWVAQVGKPAGTLAHNGYRIIGIDGKRYRAHQLAVLYMTGYLPVYPKDEVDHLNSEGDDNSWDNLELTNHTGNVNNPVTVARRAEVFQSPETRKKMSDSGKRRWDH